MKDLYARTGLRPYEPDSAQLQAALRGSTADIEAARYVLLHDGRRTVYDRTHATLTDIGVVRAALDLNNTLHWRPMADFKFQVDRERQAKSPSVGWGLVAIVILVVGMVYWPSRDADRLLDTTGLTAVPKPDIRHVTVDTLNVRAEATPTARILGQLQKYETVDVASQDVEGDWAAITYQDAKGYVAAEYLAVGDGRIAEDADCFEAGTRRPYSGEVLERSGGRGEHVLTIHASASSDAIVKLKAAAAATALSMYVRAGETASVKSIPDGQYRFQFATGKDYGPSCGRFVTEMRAFADNEIKALTTRDVPGGYRVSTIEYTLYDVASGNFHPTPIDPSAF